MGIFNFLKKKTKKTKDIIPTKLNRKNNKNEIVFSQDKN